jgi:hypothetical protein
MDGQTFPQGPKVSRSPNLIKSTTIFAGISHGTVGIDLGIVGRTGPLSNFVGLGLGLLPDWPLSKFGKR